MEHAFLANNRKKRSTAKAGTAKSCKTSQILKIPYDVDKFGNDSFLILNIKPYNDILVIATLIL